MNGASKELYIGATKINFVSMRRGYAKQVIFFSEHVAQVAITA